jgi:dihydroxyacetone kinase-like protein
MERGRARAGDKTMVDALLPAVHMLKEAAAKGLDAVEAVDGASRQALRGAEETMPMTARKGRASYLGERSRGHQDPGATSSYLIIEALNQVLAAGFSPLQKG